MYEFVNVNIYLNVYFSTYTYVNKYIFTHIYIQIYIRKYFYILQSVFYWLLCKFYNTNLSIYIRIHLQTCKFYFLWVAGWKDICVLVFIFLYDLKQTTNNSISTIREQNIFLRIIKFINKTTIVYFLYITQR